MGELSIGGYSLKRENQILDIIILDETWADDAISSLRHVGLFPVLDLPFLILLKMSASRATDIGDIQRMLHGASDEERDRVRNAFQKYAPQDLEDLEQLIWLSDQAW